jgi:hypothetical protein
MTHCVICGKRLWFEEWRSIDKYADYQQFDNVRPKPVAWLYKIQGDRILTYYNRNDKNKLKVWYHLNCIKKHGMPTDNLIRDESLLEKEETSSSEAQK